MRKIDSTVVYNIYTVYNNNDVAYYVRELDESPAYFATKLFEELKTENTKHFSIYSYGNPEYDDAILEYDNDEDEGESLWVIPEDDLFEYKFKIEK